MNIYNKKFVHFEWDESLEGKTVFVADNIPDLMFCVRRNDKGCMTKISKNSGEGNHLPSHPFKGDNGVCWRFCYSDPLYKYKAAYNAGKKVEWRCENDEHWNTVDDNWSWDDWDLIEDCAISYRIADEEAKHKTERLTKRQLSRWLAQGNGEIMCDGGDTMSVAFIYPLGEENEEVTGQFLVRRWEDTEWHEPTVGYCFPVQG